MHSFGTLDFPGLVSQPTTLTRTLAFESTTFRQPCVLQNVFGPYPVTPPTEWPLSAESAGSSAPGWRTRGAAGSPVPAEFLHDIDEE